MGDVLMTGPAIFSLRKKYPKARITLLVSRLGAKIAPFLPGIDDFIVFDSPWVRTYAKTPSSFSLNKISKLLKIRKFDAAIIFTVFSQNPLPSAMLLYLSDIPLRLGYCHENPYHLLSDWVPDPEPQKFIRHEVKRQIDLVSRIGCENESANLSIKLPLGSFQRMQKKILAEGVDLKRNFLIIHPGCTEARRRYDAKFFAGLGKILKKYEKQILITGSEEEKNLAEEVASFVGKDAFSLAGKFEIDEFCALISASSLVISNNTVPVHIASAVGTPVLDIYAKTNPQHTPWMVPSGVLYFNVPCKECQRGICVKTKHPSKKAIPIDRAEKMALKLIRFKTSVQKYG